MSGTWSSVIGGAAGTAVGGPIGGVVGAGLVDWLSDEAGSWFDGSSDNKKAGWSPWTDGDFNINQSDPEYNKTMTFWNWFDSGAGFQERHTMTQGHFISLDANKSSAKKRMETYLAGWTPWNLKSAEVQQLLEYVNSIIPPGTRSKGNAKYAADSLPGHYLRLSNGDWGKVKEHVMNGLATLKTDPKRVFDTFREWGFDFEEPDYGTQSKPKPPGSGNTANPFEDEPKQTNDYPSSDDNQKSTDKKSEGVSPMMIGLLLLIFLFFKK